VSLGIPCFSQALPRHGCQGFELPTSNFDSYAGRRHSNTYIIVVTIIPNFALFSYLTTDRFHNQVYPHLVRVLENGLRDLGATWKVSDRRWVNVELLGSRVCAKKIFDLKVCRTWSRNVLIRSLKLSSHGDKGQPKEQALLSYRKGERWRQL